jgi:integrase
VNNKTKTIRLEAIDTKTKAPRNIKLNDEINEDLRRLFQESMDEYGNPHNKYVFTLDKKGRLINNNYFYSEWKKAVKKCKSFSQEFVWSDTRRTAVRDMIRSGIPEKIVMQITGHRSRSIIDRYNIVNEEDLEIANEMRQAYLKRQEDIEPWTVD